MWNRVLCKVLRRNPILSVFKLWLNGSTERFQSLWHAWMLKWKKMYWNVGWHMLRPNPGTVLMKVFVQTWAFLGCISLVSPMNAWVALRRGARAVLAKKRMSDLLQQQVSFQAMEQQQFEWKKTSYSTRRVCQGRFLKQIAKCAKGQGSTIANFTRTAKHRIFKLGTFLFQSLPQCKICNLRPFVSSNKRRLRYFFGSKSPRKRRSTLIPPRICVTQCDSICSNGGTSGGTWPAFPKKSL